MRILYVNKRKILRDFEKLSNIWLASETIFLRLDIKPSDIEIIINELLEKLPNDLAYSILSEIAAYENLNEELMQLIFDKGDKGCKVAICLNKNLPHKLQEHCKRSSDRDIKEHFQQRE